MQWKIGRPALTTCSLCRIQKQVIHSVKIDHSEESSFKVCFLFRNSELETNVRVLKLFSNIVPFPYLFEAILNVSASFGWYPYNRPNKSERPSDIWSLYYKRLLHRLYRTSGCILHVSRHEISLAWNLSWGMRGLHRFIQSSSFYTSLTHSYSWIAYTKDRPTSDSFC